MGFLIFMLMGIVLVPKDVYRMITATDYGSMQRKVDDLLQTLPEQEAKIRRLHEELRYRR